MTVPPASFHRRLTLASAAALLLSLAQASAAHAAAPRWQIEAFSASTAASPQPSFEYRLDIFNVGTAATDGSPVEVTALLPPGVTATQASVGVQSSNKTYPCAGVGTSAVHCTVTEAIPAPPGAHLLKLDLLAGVAPGLAGTLTAVFSVSGGGAPALETVDPVRVLTGTPSFGLAGFDTGLLQESGAPATLAGVHPFADLTTFALETTNEEHGLQRGLGWPLEPLRDAGADLPPGVLGDPSVMDRCTLPQLSNGFQREPESLCPPASQVGVVFTPSSAFSGSSVGADGFPPVPLFNLVPPPGVPASFGFDLQGSVVVLDAHLRTGAHGGYFLSVEGSAIPEGLAVAGNRIEFWGDPAAEAHDPERACPGFVAPSDNGPSAPAGCPEQYSPRPAHQAFLRTPTRCVPAGEGLLTRFHADSWTHPGARLPSGAPALGDPAWKTSSSLSHEPPGFPWPDEPSVFPAGYTGPTAFGPTVGIEGCEALPFAPSFEAQPTSAEADSPSGLHVAIAMPQQGLEDPEAIAESDLKKVVMRFPAGVTVNPSSANGQQACSPAQVGLASAPGATPVSFDEEPVRCPDASKIGTVELESPLLAKYHETTNENGETRTEPLLDGEGHHVLEVLHGAVYLASQDQNPFASLIALYLVVEDEHAGIRLKLPGRVNLDPSTGQLETVFDENPQLPFSHLSVDLFGGSRAALRLPAACGEYPLQALLTGWSGKTVESTSSFRVQSGPGGGACPTGAFNPSFQGGTLSSAAGAFSPYMLSFSRNDGEQQLSGLTNTFAPGLLGKLAGVPRCAEADANAGTCPAASRLGSVTVLAGSGPAPVTLRGSIYLTGPYSGGPFGEAVVIPAVAGPFDLGNVVVRGAIRIDPVTAQAIDVSDPFPQFVGSTGIPSDVRRVEVVIDRPGFTFNATSCDPSSVTATLTGAQGTPVPVSSRYQASGCAALKFKPSFKASTEANDELKRHGASLDVKIATHQGPGSGEANIHKVEVALPKILPSRLTTLQKACTEKQFNTNPAGCPHESNVGTAIANTPLLDHPLTGPAYLVSHGNQAFPDLVLVLQGEGITLDVTGHTQIRNGVTYSRFETVPDAPISSFELKLPEGPYSALAAVTPPCGKNLTTTKRVRKHGRLVKVKTTRHLAANLNMPTTITAQDNSVIRQTTKISVTGCPKAKKAKRHRSSRRHR